MTSMSVLKGVMANPGPGRSIYFGFLISNFGFSSLTSPLQCSPLFSANFSPCTDELQRHCRQGR
jgi:hypothetical protein